MMVHTKRKLNWCLSIGLQGCYQDVRRELRDADWASMEVQCFAAIVASEAKPHTKTTHTEVYTKYSVTDTYILKHIYMYTL